VQPRQPMFSNHNSNVIYMKNKPLFPISWLQKQDYCEYQIYLENVKGIEVKPTKAMTQGSQQHEQLYNEFAKKAKPATVEQMLLESKTEQIYCREFRVVDLEHGIYGLIDEIWLTPEGFIVIDDKPGVKVYPSNIHQVYGYCLAYQSVISQGDQRGIFGALRERGTDNIYWRSPFDKGAIEEIVPLINRIHALLIGKERFTSTDNQNKCKVCPFGSRCDRMLH
jgi:CRISPR-associated exonuclease Cas4